MPAKAISTESAKSDKLFYFVATAIVYRESDKRCLILKRDERERVHPGKWAMPGGKLEWGDFDLKNPTSMHDDVIVFDYAIKELLEREVREEAGIEIEDRPRYIKSLVFIRPDGIPVILADFAAKYKSGDIVLEEGAFTEYAWVNESEVMKYDLIDGVADEVKETIKIFNNG
ncbi:MAG: NUDIX domain-containing protein [Parcubacteria group bacterium]|nr:NUDIX domain-containing protein [Parcubacteria group bacterium]